MPDDDTPSTGTSAAPDTTDAAEPSDTQRTSRSIWSRIVMRSAFYILVIVVGWCLLVWFGQRRVVFPQHTLGSGAEVEPLVGMEAITINTPAGEVEAWYKAADDTNPNNPAPTVIYAHGNAELIEHTAEMLMTYTSIGVNVLIPEYRGYGRSAGEPSKAAITADYKAFYDKLIERPEVDPDRIIFHGRSLGAGVVAALAREHKPAALICESSFTSMADVAWRYFIPSFLVRDPFDVEGYLDSYDGPVLILHGEADQTIPASHADRLHAAAANSTLKKYPDVNHNESPPLGEYWSDIESFLRDSEILKQRQQWDDWRD